MKETDRQRIGRCLQWIDAWRASGMKLKDWCQLQGEQLPLWRARLRWEQRWRHGVGATARGAQFVQALPQPKLAAPTSAQAASVRIEIGAAGAHLRASVELPLSALPSCAAWLREVLA